MQSVRWIITLALAVSTGAGLAAEAKDKAKAADKKSAKPAASAVAAAPTEKGRDWTQIDTNKDGYISPEEMDAWLKANPGPQR